MDQTNKLFNLVKQGVLKTSQQDKTTNQKKFYNAQIKNFNSLNQCQVLYPYGYFAVAPEGSKALVFNVGGQAEYRVAVPYDNATQFTGRKPGECGIGHQRIQSYIDFLNDGSINVETPNGNLNIRVLKGNASVNITGNKTETISGNATSTISGAQTDTVTGAIDVTTSSTYDVKASGNATIDSDTQVQIVAGGATLTLTSSGLVSSVPISAPAIEILGTGDLTMNGGNITGNTDMVTQAGKSFNGHIHSPGTYTVNHGGIQPVDGNSGTLV